MSWGEEYSDPDCLVWSYQLVGVIVRVSNFDWGSKVAVMILHEKTWGVFVCVFWGAWQGSGFEVLLREHTGTIDSNQTKTSQSGDIVVGSVR